MVAIMRDKLTSLIASIDELGSFGKLHPYAIDLDI
jgi:hypothetical protein